MEKLKKLEQQIIKRLEEIRDIDNKTLNDYEEYKELQHKLGEVQNVIIYINRMENENDK